MGIAHICEDGMSTLVTLERHDVITRTDTRPPLIRQSLVNKMIDKTSHFVKLESRGLQEAENVSLLSQLVTKMTEATLVSKDFLKPMAVTVKNETQKAVDVISKR